MGDFWGIEQKITDITEAIKAAGETELNTESLETKLESIDEHLAEIAESVPAALDRLTEQVALLRQDFTERG